jgi:hypothetical protein
MLAANTMQRRGKYISAATNEHATKQELLEAVISIRSATSEQTEDFTCAVVVVL